MMENKNKSKFEIDEYGTKYWCNEDGLYHREDGPAVEYKDGTKEWHFRGKCHRLDGPAWIHYNGDTDWFINDYYVTKEINKWAKENSIDLDNLTDVDKALIKIFWVDYGE